MNTKKDHFDGIPNEFNGTTQNIKEAQDLLIEYELMARIAGSRETLLHRCKTTESPIYKSHYDVKEWCRNRGSAIRLYFEGVVFSYIERIKNESKMDFASIGTSHIRVQDAGEMGCGVIHCDQYLSQCAYSST